MHLACRGMAGNDQNAIVVEGLEKAYGSVRALQGVTFAARAGTVLGLLGPNGAGKTPAVRILATLLKPDAGHATVAGLDVVREAPALRAKIGLAGQYAAVDENLTGFENLEMVGQLEHLPRREARARANELLERFDLVDAAKRPAKTYSGGMRRRLDLPAALVLRPPGPSLDPPPTAPPAGPLPRRADDRPRPGQPLVDVGDDRGPHRGRHDGPAHDAVPRRGRPA